MVLLRPRQRKLVASLALGFWLFAVFVSVVHACTLDGAVAGPYQVKAGATDHQGQDDDAPPGCEQFCNDEFPVPAKLTLGQDQPGDQALLLAPVLATPIVTAAPPVTLLLERPHPLPGIALYARFLRLAL